MCTAIREQFAVQAIFYDWFTFSFLEKQGQNIKSAKLKQTIRKKQKNRRFGVKTKQSNVL